VILHLRVVCSALLVFERYSCRTEIEFDFFDDVRNVKEMEEGEGECRTHARPMVESVCGGVHGARVYGVW